MSKIFDLTIPEVIHDQRSPGFSSIKQLIDIKLVIQGNASVCVWKMFILCDQYDL